MQGSQQENKNTNRYLGAVAAIVVGIALIITANMHEKPGHKPPLLGIGLTALGIMYLISLLFRTKKNDN